MSGVSELREASGVRACSPPFSDGGNDVFASSAMWDLGAGAFPFGLLRRNPLAITVHKTHSKSGAEDTRSPDASRMPGVSEPREASGMRACSPPLSDGG